MPERYTPEDITASAARAVAEQRIVMPVWVIALLGIASPMLSAGLSYVTTSGKQSSVLEQRLGDMERRAQATDSRLDSIGDKLATVSTSVAVLVERTQHAAGIGPAPR